MEQEEKQLRQKGLSFGQRLEGRQCILLALFKGDYTGGLQTAAEPSGQDGGVTAIGTEGSGGVIVG